MKKIVALVVMALVLVGCNNNSTEYVEVEVGEPKVVEQNVNIECGEFLMLNVMLEPEQNLTIQYGEDNETLGDVWGMDYSLIAGYECPEPEETEREPVDGVCDEGWEFANDCATVCTPIVEVCLTESLCGEGTVLDENNTCQIDDAPDMGICGEGTELNEETDTCEIVEPTPV